MKKECSKRARDERTQIPQKAAFRWLDSACDTLKRGGEIRGKFVLCSQGRLEENVASKEVSRFFYSRALGKSRRLA